MKTTLAFSAALGVVAGVASQLPVVRDRAMLVKAGVRGAPIAHNVTLAGGSLIIPAGCNGAVVASCNFISNRSDDPIADTDSHTIPALSGDDYVDPADCPGASWTLVDEADETHDSIYSCDNCGRTGTGLQLTGHSPWGEKP